VAACSGALDFGVDEEAVLVAIDDDFFDDLDRPRCGAFVPEFVAASRPVIDFAGFDGFVEGFFIHVGEHGDFACFHVCRDAGDEAFFVEFWFEL